ncbi:unnamed protein product [Effrenium voratum]|uniref:Uncharacterized protein n=1 Tax=Effrenium voratum TaxID=2562239 RepID=A0AA36NB61_9DINO|nr:unnamed protein product [Effrenium voratum]
MSRSSAARELVEIRQRLAGLQDEVASLADRVTALELASEFELVLPTEEAAESPRSTSAASSHAPVSTERRLAAARSIGLFWLVPWVGKRGEFGDSVFTGFPSEWEARAAVTAAGLETIARRVVPLQLFSRPSVATVRGASPENRSPKSFTLTCSSAPTVPVLRCLHLALTRPAAAVSGLPLPGLDPAVVNAAIAAGISREHLAEMSALIQKRPGKLGDIPAPAAKRPLAARADPLSASASEEEEPEPAKGVDPVAKALSKLTEIADALASNRKQERGLQAILEGAGSNSSHGEGASGSAGRRNAVALQQLRAALSSQPAYIYERIEANLRADFNLARQLPGSSAVPVSARAWLELRSKVQPYQTNIRFIWGIAGVWDCLMNEEPGELSLEESPPFSAFNHHRLPEGSETPFTKLAEPVWLDLLLWKLKEIEDFLDKRSSVAHAAALLVGPKFTLVGG